MSAVQTDKKLSRRDVLGVWVRSLVWWQACYNYERLQGTGFGVAMAPALKKLYEKKEDLIAALKRHVVFFNSEGHFGAVIPGMVLAMEEQRAAGAEISDDAINGLKTSLMGPLAGIGDTITQGIMQPIVLSICIAMASEGNVLGPILYMLVLIGYAFGVSYIFFTRGYRLGGEFVEGLLEGAQLNRLTQAASIVGLMAAGVFAVNFVHVSIPFTITVGETSVIIQDILDRIVPKLLPLGTVLLAWHLGRRSWNLLRILALLFAIGLVGGWLGVLGP